MADPQLTEEDLTRIRAAVAEAEARTSGEIVPYVVERSGTYEVALWRGGAAGTVLGTALAMLIAWGYDGWGLGWLYTAWGIVLVALASGLLGALVTGYSAPLRRVLAGADRLARQVHQRAVLAFLDEEVFATRDRTGILLFVSLFEHRIEVLGDQGINAKVQPEEWAEVVERIRQGIVQQRFADGLVDAIGRCGALLERKGVALQPNDTDELPDSVRLRRE